ncbi:MAG TPA: methyltransferase domain-containing protein [Sphingomicrobium sp.]|nr:methyltransferase domain-containing protein [Sphingomicrobium sp.]
MNVADLPKLGVIENPLDGDLFGQWSDLSGKDLLILGMSEHQIDRFVSVHTPNSATILTLWADHIDAESKKYSTIIGDITQRTDFHDNQFDIVISMSVLEHVSNLHSALDEMGRIGKEMLHIFGPAWSCPYGHHLSASDTDPNLNFVRWQLPAHMHLLCSEKEICDYYDGLGYDRSVGQFVFGDMHKNPHINRLFYDEYVTAFHRFQVVRWECMFSRLPPDHLQLLKSLYGDRDFGTYGGCYKLF